MINKRARKLTTEYKNETGEHDRETNKIYLTFKFADTSLPLIKAAVKLMNDSERSRRYFEMVANKIDPRDNRHPLAQEVYKKVQQALDFCSQFS